MKSNQDTTPDSRASTSAYDEPSTDVNETPLQAPPVEAGANVLAGVPTDPIEEIKRKYGPDIIRPASQLPPPATHTDRKNRPKPRVASST
jgi:hypothetical protein